MPKKRKLGGLSKTEGVAPEDALALSGAAERCFAILEYAASAGHPLTPIEISEALGLPRPSTYRLMDTLERLGFLSRQGSARRITVGPRLTDLAFQVLRASVQYGPRRLILASLVRRIGETGNIGTLDRDEVVYLDRVEADHWPLRLQFNIGSRVPLYCTAIGKLFLALLPQERTRTLLDRLQLVRFTESTIIDRKVLEGELQKIRQDGIALDREEYIAGVVCIAAPILNKKSEIQAAVAIQAPSARMSVGQALGYREMLIDAASQLTVSFNDASF